MSGSLWVDDSKPEPGGCSVARTYDDALRMLRAYEWDVVYLDHDLGDHHVPERTGYDLLKQMIADNRVPPRVECISWNPVGVKRINDLYASYLAKSAVEGPSVTPKSRRRGR